MVFFLSCYFMYKIFLRRPDGSMCSENGLILCFNGLSSCVLLLTSFFCLAQRSRHQFWKQNPWDDGPGNKIQLNSNKDLPCFKLQSFQYIFHFWLHQHLQHSQLKRAVIQWKTVQKLQWLQNLSNVEIMIFSEYPMNRWKFQDRDWIIASEFYKEYLRNDANWRHWTYW